MMESDRSPWNPLKIWDPIVIFDYFYIKWQIFIACFCQWSFFGFPSNFRNYQFSLELFSYRTNLACLIYMFNQLEVTENLFHALLCFLARPSDTDQCFILQKRRKHLNIGGTQHYTFSTLRARLTFVLH